MKSASDLIGKYSKHKPFVFRNTDKFGFLSTGKKFSEEYFPPFFFSQKIHSKIFYRTKKTREMIIRGIPLHEKNVIWPQLINEWTEKTDLLNDNSELKNFSMKKIFNCVDCNLIFWKKRKEINQKPIKFFFDQNDVKDKTVIQIHLDVQRTFCTHVLFCDKYGFGQQVLFHLLLDLAKLLPTVEYCQGFSSICAVLLMFTEKKNALNLIVYFIKLNGIESLFDKNLSAFPIILEKQSFLFKILYPKLLSHIEKNFNISSLVCRWFSSLFSQFKIELVLRIYDLMFYFGFSVLFLVALAVFKINEKLIFQLKKEQLVLFLNKMESREYDCDKFINIVEKNLKRYSIKKISKL